MNNIVQFKYNTKKDIQTLDNAIEEAIFIMMDRFDSYTEAKKVVLELTHKRDRLLNRSIVS